MGFVGKFSSYGKAFDESRFAQVAADEKGFALKSIDITSQDFIDNIEKVIEITELFEADLVATKQTMEQTQRIIGQFLKTGKITADDAFETYVKKRANNEWKVEKDKTSDWLNAFNQRTLEENTTLPAPKKGTAHTEANLKKRKKEDLIEICKEKGLGKSGTKEILIARILE